MKRYPILSSLLVTYFISIIALLITNYNFFKSSIIEIIVDVTMYGIIIVYPYVLTIIQLGLCLTKRSNSNTFEKAYIFEIISLVLGIIYTPLYLLFSQINIFASWQTALYNRQIHSPINPAMYPSIITFLLLGLGGYLILRLIPLKKLPPLISVMSISAIYLGVFICLFWIIQVFSFDYLYLILLPLNWILIVIRLVKEKIFEWQNLNDEDKKDFKSKLLQKLNNELMNAADWPIMAFILMVPLLGICLGILIIFGQYPDDIIKAWTQTSDWNLSQKIAPQNIYVDQHYLCTVAAGGHWHIVKPLRKGVRHGHEVIVNRQLCIANAFEQIIEEKLPHFHRMIRYLYDRYGYPFAKNIHSPYLADLIYLLMKPLEYIFLLVIYLVDVKPENRIAMQYISPIPKTFKR